LAIGGSHLCVDLVLRIFELLIMNIEHQLF
jgi:hypothetical protein